MTPAIVVENLAKSYRVNHEQVRRGYRTLRESLTSAAAAPINRLRSAFGSQGSFQARSTEEFWALKDVSFEVQPGEVVGIIGRNGAGKSTLLKILSRITKPTRGRVTLNGRVGSLLEVGTGFHPELTGRENIFMNGSILGMSRREIQRKFDEIVSFAEIDRFLDMPVKRYSSGMYVRLAFGVAAHFQPEILLVDEVLAVGDPGFQKKCLGKMKEVSETGRTVFLVSHNMAAIQSLCLRCILVSNGQITSDGDVDIVLEKYHSSFSDCRAASANLASHAGRSKRTNVFMTAAHLSGSDGGPASSISMGDSLVVTVAFDAQMFPIRPVLGVVVKTRLGSAVFGVNNRFIPGYSVSQAIREGHITCRIDKPPLMPGHYLLDLYLGNDHEDHDVVHEALAFEVMPADVFGSGKLPPPAAGPICWPATWSFSSTRSG